MSDDARYPWSYPGARWWKFDFHTHTPAAKDTSAWQAAIGTLDVPIPEPLKSNTATSKVRHVQ